MATERVGSQSVHLQHQSFYAADGGEQSFDDFDLVKKRKKKVLTGQIIIIFCASFDSGKSSSTVPYGKK